MKITIQTVPHHQQRYDTAGDWQYLDMFTLLISVSKLDDWKMEACLGFHELAEALICKWLNISQTVVDDFDFAFKGDGEPGDAPDCPYRIPHRVASAVEYILALALEVDWAAYEARLNAL